MYLCTLRVHDGYVGIHNARYHFDGRARGGFNIHAILLYFNLNGVDLAGVG